eukprot:6057346-Pyramimonas_sp.AAC.1
MRGGREPRVGHWAGSRICGGGQRDPNPGSCQLLRSARSGWRRRLSTYEQRCSTMRGHGIGSFIMGWSRIRIRGGYQRGPNQALAGS